MAYPELVSVPELKAALEAAAGPGARTAAMLPDERLAANLADAHAEVLGKVSTRYALPADAGTAPAMLKSIIIAVAAYAATLEWLQGKDLSDRDAVALRYQRAVGMLKDITSGVLTLELPAPYGGAAVDAAIYGGSTVSLTDDVHAPTYGGLVPDGWQGGGIKPEVGW